MNASDDIKAAREAKQARKTKIEQQAIDVHTQQLAFEKNLKAQAEELWRAMFEDDYTRVDIQHYFDDRGEYLKELGRKNLHRKGVISTQSKDFVSDDNELLNIFVEDNLEQVAAEGRDVIGDTPKTDDSATVRSVDDSTIMNTQNADIFTGATPTQTGPATWRNAAYDQPAKAAPVTANEPAAQVINFADYKAKPGMIDLTLCDFCDTKMNWGAGRCPNPRCGATYTEHRWRRSVAVGD